MGSISAYLLYITCSFFTEIAIFIMSFAFLDIPVPWKKLPVPTLVIDLTAGSAALFITMHSGGRLWVIMLLDLMIMAMNLAAVLLLFEKDRAKGTVAVCLGYFCYYQIYTGTFLISSAISSILSTVLCVILCSVLGHVFRKMKVSECLSIIVMIRDGTAADCCSPVLLFWRCFMDTCEKINVVDIERFKLLEQYYTEMSLKGLSVKKYNILSNVFEKSKENKRMYYKVIYIPSKLHSMKKEFISRGWELLFIISESIYVFKSEEMIESMDDIEEKLMKLYQKKVICSSITAEILLGIVLAAMLLIPPAPVNYVLVAIFAFLMLYILVHVFLVLDVFGETLRTHMKFQKMLWGILAVFYALICAAMW